jgi:hypothetical protein
VNLIYLTNHCLRLGQLPAPWKEAKIKTLPKPGKDPKFTPNLRPISLLLATDKLFEKLTLRTIQKHTEERNFLNASQLGFRVDQSMNLQGMRLADHVTLNFNMSTDAMFLDNEKAFDTIWPRRMAAAVPQCSFFSQILYSLYILNDARVVLGTRLALFADDTGIHATEKHESRALCKLHEDSLQ